MNFIFLDFDGVMNSDKYFSSLAFKNETKGMGWDEITLDAHHAHLDHDAIQLINQLVDRSNASVVVSSTWRQHYTIDELNKMLKDRGATFTIIAATPIHRSHYIGWGMSNVCRGKEIQEYLNEIMEPVKFVILDDIDDMAHLSKYLMLTDEAVGITQEGIEKALQILSEE